MPAKKPADHLTKKPTGFTFEHGGKTFTLPPATEARAALPGRAVRDAVLEAGGDLKLVFLALEAVPTEPGVLDALYAMPADDTVRIGLEWFNTSADESGATLPQS